MSIWNTLGITPTNDLTIIKSAYAEKAKLFHPEEHPDEFLALQQAYKSAVKLAKMNARSTDGHASVTPFNTAPPCPSASESTASTYTFPSLAHTTASQDEPENSHMQNVSNSNMEEDFSFDEILADTQERFYTEFQLILQNPYLQNNLLCWDYFLNQNAYLAFLDLPETQLQMLKIICRHSNWTKDTLLFLEKYICHVFHDSPALARKFNHLKDNVSDVKEPTASQKELHSYLLNYLPSRFGNALLNTNQIAAYLNIYFKYPTIPSKIKKARAKEKRSSKNNQKTATTGKETAKAILIAFGIALLLMCFPSFLENMEKHTKNDYGKYNWYSSIGGHTLAETIDGLELLNTLPAPNLHAVLTLAENDAASIPNTSLTLYTEEELNSMQLPQIYISVINKDVSNVHGYYTRHGIFTSSYSDNEQMHAELAPSYDSNDLWGFYLIDFNHDGVDELCVRNEYGQIGCITVDTDKKHGIAFNWHIDYDHTDNSASIYNGGIQNYVLLNNGTVLEIKRTCSDGTVTIYLTIIGYKNKDYSRLYFAESPIRILRIQIDASKEDPFSYGIRFPDTGVYTTISKEEMETWLNTYILRYQIPDTDWAYLSCP